MISLALDVLKKIYLPINFTQKRFPIESNSKTRISIFITATTQTQYKKEFTFYINNAFRLGIYHKIGAKRQC